MKKNTFSLFQWWKIDEKEFTDQVVNYDNFNWWKSVRTQSITCLLFSCIVTTIFVVAKLAEINTMIDVLIMLALCPFMYKGFKASFILAMVYWTIAKIYGIATHPSSLLMAVIWWSMYMRFFYLAYLVEKNKDSILQKVSVNSGTNQADRP